VAESVITSSSRICAWVEYPYISDHAPICLQLGEERSEAAYPFKLNPAWLQEVSFDTMVRDVWNDTSHQIHEGAQCRLVRKLNCLKSRTKIWSKEKWNREREEMVNLESEIDDLL
jgi:hypothetical protein